MTATENVSPHEIAKFEALVGDGVGDVEDFLKFFDHTLFESGTFHLKSVFPVESCDLISSEELSSFLLIG